MNKYSSLLTTGAAEVNAFFEHNRARLEQPERSWRHLSESMIAAASLDGSAIEPTIHAIARNIIDEFLLNQDISPSFSEALVAVQRLEKQRRRTRG
jgi:hypothetical protein